MSYKHKDPCIKNAHDDEMLFVLMARDIYAPETIIEWIKNSLRAGHPPEKLHEALDCAIEMTKTSHIHKSRANSEKLKAKKDNNSHKPPY